MTKFLTAILLLTIGLKFFAESGAFMYKYDAVNLSVQDEEGKKDKGKHENGKYDNEDKIHAYYSVHYIPFNIGGKSSSSFRHLKFFSGFVEPNTPPPDLI